MCTSAESNVMSNTHISTKKEKKNWPRRRNYCWMVTKGENRDPERSPSTSFLASRIVNGNHYRHMRTFLFCFVLFCYLGTSHHQAHACHMASVYLGFRSIWNTHFCLRLQPHLYPSLIVTSLGRDVRPNSDISKRMSSPTPPSKTRNYC